jgi:hypothetical protein
MKTSTIRKFFSAAIILGLTSGIVRASDKLEQIAGPKGAQTFVLKQQCRSLEGNYTVQFDKNNLRIESRELILVASAPKWSIKIVNVPKKNYLQADYMSGLRQLTSARAAFSPFTDAAPFKLQSHNEKVVELAADEWLSTTTRADKKKLSKCWTLKSKEVDPHCAEIIATYYGIPFVGLPLKCTYKGAGNDLMPMTSRQFDVEGSKEQEFRWLETTEASLSPRVVKPYMIPKDFKLAKQFSEVTTAPINSHTEMDARFILEDIKKHPDSLFNSR